MPDRALDGLRVIEINTTNAAAYAGKLMADLGADVVKIEPPGHGDPSRALGPFPDGVPHPEKSGLFLYLNCNKRSVALDLAGEPGAEALRKLLEGADVLIQDFHPKEADALGLTYEKLRPANERIVMTSITPFGLSGPERDYKAYDLTTASAGGWTWINGWPGRPDMPPFKAYGRQTAYQAGVTAAMTTMGALFARLRGAPGQHIEISAQECIASILEMTVVTWPYMGIPAVRWGQRPIQPVDFFQCKDGGWIFALAVEEHQWLSIVELMDGAEWTKTPEAANRFTRASNWEALRPHMEQWAAEWTADELYRAAQAKRVPFAPVSTIGDLLNSEHLKARGFFAEVVHPVAGAVTQPGAPYKLSETPWEIRSPAPALGQHTLEVLQEAGVSDAEALAKAGSA